MQATLKQRSTERPTSALQKPWVRCEPYDFEPIDVNSLPAGTRNHLLSYSIEFVSLGFLHAGDYRMTAGDEVHFARFFRSADGAVLGWVTDKRGDRSFNLGSVLEDGTYVQSTPRRPVAPWSCCRFPVHVIFGPGLCVEDLLIRHLNTLIDVEAGCGATIKYEPSQLREVVHYTQMLVHETVYTQGAPTEVLPVPQSERVREPVSV